MKHEWRKSEKELYMPKKSITPEGYFEYAVYPLEGIWDLISYDIVDEVIEKDNLKYKIMIR